MSNPDPYPTLNVLLHDEQTVERVLTDKKWKSVRHQLTRGMIALIRYPGTVIVGDEIFEDTRYSPLIILSKCVPTEADFLEIKTEQPYRHGVMKNPPRHVRMYANRIRVNGEDIHCEYDTAVVFTELQRLPRYE